MCLLAYVVGVVFIYKLLDRILRIPYILGYRDRYVFITGCDSGFGHELAKRLDSFGCHVFAGCLTEYGETELKKSCSDRLMPISLDVTKPDSVRKAFQVVSDKLDKDRQELHAVVNNAGVGTTLGPPEWISIHDYRKTMAVNLYGTIDVTMTFLPLVKRSRGRIVNMSSMAGRMCGFGLLPYSVSKYGVEAFTDGLRRSLRPYGCKAILVEPGYYKTSLLSRDAIVDLIKQAWQQTSPEIKEEFGEDYFRAMMIEMPKRCHELAYDRVADVVDAYEHALLGRYPRARYVVGILYQLVFLPLLALPEWLTDWILDVVGVQLPIPAVLKK
jgi:NAD(P)-dependent dehydrogenase (short-subunit alcohol dehydrogenase family)